MERVWSEEVSLVKERVRGVDGGRMDGGRWRVCFERGWERWMDGVRGRGRGRGRGKYKYIV